MSDFKKVMVAAMTAAFALCTSFGADEWDDSYSQSHTNEEVKASGFKYRQLGGIGASDYVLVDAEASTNLATKAEIADMASTNAAERIAQSVFDSRLASSLTTTNRTLAARATDVKAALADKVGTKTDGSIAGDLSLVGSATRMFRVSKDADSGLGSIGFNHLGFYDTAKSSWLKFPEFQTAGNATLATTDDFTTFKTLYVDPIATSVGTKVDGPFVTNAVNALTTNLYGKSGGYVSGFLGIENVDGSLKIKKAGGGTQFFSDDHYDFCYHEYDGKYGVANSSSLRVDGTQILTAGYLLDTYTGRNNTGEYGGIVSDSKITMLRSAVLDDIGATMRSHLSDDIRTNDLHSATFTSKVYVGDELTVHKLKVYNAANFGQNVKMLNPENLLFSKDGSTLKAKLDGKQNVFQVTELPTSGDFQNLVVQYVGTTGDSAAYGQFYSAEATANGTRTVDGTVMNTNGVEEAYTETRTVYAYSWRPLNVSGGGSEAKTIADGGASFVSGELKADRRYVLTYTTNKPCVFQMEGDRCEFAIANGVDGSTTSIQLPEGPVTILLSHNGAVSRYVGYAVELATASGNSYHVKIEKLGVGFYRAEIVEGGQI